MSDPSKQLICANGHQMAAGADWCSECGESPAEGSRRWLNMDGMLHVVGADDLCGCRRRRRYCRKCNLAGRQSVLHEQPIYAGVAEACEVCDRDWEIGALPKHDSAMIIGETDEPDEPQAEVK